MVDFKVYDALTKFLGSKALQPIVVVTLVVVLQ